MSKKQKVLETEIDAKSSNAQDKISEGDVVTENKTISQDKTEKDKSKDKKKKKDKKDRKSFGRKVRETTSELKKVTWPTFGEVCKKTGIVIAFVLICGVFLYGVNYLLGGLINLLINGSWS
jgi:preprotein translocase subunit SecE